MLFRYVEWALSAKSRWHRGYMLLLIFVLDGIMFSVGAIFVFRRRGRKYVYFSKTMAVFFLKLYYINF